MATEQVDAWLDAYPASRFHAIAKQRLAALPKRRPRHVLTSVGRLVRQKASLMLEPLHDGRPALVHVLDALDHQGVLILLGSGEAEYENRIADIAERADNLLFLCGYSATLAEPLYRSGDLFLMPSSFEPCGISQMLAMRAAQPCVVHGVGGLSDTVTDGANGFVFTGPTPTEQAEAFVAKVAYALELRQSSRKHWQRLRRAAAAARFDWSQSAAAYEKDLYGIESA